MAPLQPVCELNQVQRQPVDPDSPFHLLRYRYAPPQYHKLPGVCTTYGEVHRPLDQVPYVPPEEAVLYLRLQTCINMQSQDTVALCHWQGCKSMQLGLLHH